MYTSGTMWNVSSDSEENALLWYVVISFFVFKVFLEYRKGNCFLNTACSWDPMDTSGTMWNVSSASEESALLCYLVSIFRSSWKREKVTLHSLFLNPKERHSMHACRVHTSMGEFPPIDTWASQDPLVEVSPHKAGPKEGRSQDPLVEVSPQKRAEATLMTCLLCWLWKEQQATMSDKQEKKWKIQGKYIGRKCQENKGSEEEGYWKKICVDVSCVFRHVLLSQKNPHNQNALQHLWLCLCYMLKNVCLG